MIIGIAGGVVALCCIGAVCFALMIHMNKTAQPPEPVQATAAVATPTAASAVAAPPVATQEIEMGEAPKQKFDPHTGAPIPKFDTYTGKQNW